MNTNKLLSVLRDIRLLKFVSEDELQKLVDDYPYFQQAHILLAKKLLLDNDPHFEKQLHIAAIYASDRANLRTIMLGADKDIIQELHDHEISAGTLNKEPLIEELSHALMSNMPQQDNLPEEENYDAVVNENTITEAESLEELEEASLPSEAVNEDELSHASMSDMLPAGDTMLEEENYEAMTEENTITEATAMEELEEASLPSEAAKENELSHASMSDMLPQQDTILEEENYGILTEENTVTEATAMEELESVAATPSQSNGKSATEGFNINQPHTFSDWLNFIENSPRALLHKSSAPDYQPISVPDTPANQAVDDTLVTIEHTPDILVAEPADNLQAIDKFVADTAHVSDLVKVIPIKQLADKSVEENDELLTETLARIYEEQGLYTKAIRVYAKLSLKFPQKSVYFASLIKDLKSKI